ncbi:hypothetical protein JRO89_XS02G0269600 [Xanthoceras sorbifolium]|uniref:Acyl-CoA N-acyltransferase n=1 Tax=Xanthoceras sorbifolium TaxID=99658 RepID=A0ABQ8IH28_9ROSI|nr:hypothetical protein JRO89_XS02G0269600 [Xanthoceras sorbifolium]
MAAVVSYCKPPPFLGRLPRNFAGVSENQGTPKKIYLSVVSSILEVSSDDWDACAIDATGHENFNPFLTHGFLSSLEESGSAVKETGWAPCHIIAKDECENILGVVPLYLKSHSYGEFVFDHSWADAYYGYGLRYYPKFQCCVPFTPVTGPRILVRNTPLKEQVTDVIITALKDLTAKSRVSSLHITFPSETEWNKLREQGFLPRIGMQYHWKNRNYKNKMKAIDSVKLSWKTYLSICSVNFAEQAEGVLDAAEGKQFGAQSIWDPLGISTQNLTMKRLRGHEIKASHWDSFYKFYKTLLITSLWGTPYLTRDFFHNMGSKMGDQVLLVVAEEGDELVAGALNLIGGDTLYGRLWGCDPRAYYPSLHFEACYYQAIEAAIELNLNTVEAGAQGEHKIQRGYMPVTTYSCHYLMDEDFRKPIENFLVHESTQVLPNTHLHIEILVKMQTISFKASKLPFVT